MAIFIARRIAVSLLILIVSTFLMYVLVAVSGDPIGDLRLNPSPNAENLIEARIELLDLDSPIPQRYAKWAAGAAGCALPGLDCDLGRNIRAQEVDVLLGQAMSATLRLVLAASALAFLLGVVVGIVSALRQYTGFDYTITFAAFLFFSLPIFWVAVLLKQYFAINLNDWLRDPQIPPVPLALVSLLVGLTAGAVIGGDRRRRWIARGAAAGGAALLMIYLDAVEWFRRPALGPALISLLAIGTAVGVAALVAGLRRRNVLYATLVTAGVGIAAQFFVTPLIRDPDWANWGTIALLAVASIAVAIGIGLAFGQLDKGQAIRACLLTALATGGFIMLDALLREVPAYSRRLNGILVATTGSNTPNFTGNFWQVLIDTIGHLVLPMTAIMLISFAQYSRYARAAMLDVLNQDYIRTARAKGLTERSVVMRHALRNAMIPLATLAALDFSSVFSGAIITEVVFGWRGMGFLFQQGLLEVDPNPVMGFYLITAVAVLLFNMLADVAYAYLDPRIRLS